VCFVVHNTTSEQECVILTTLDVGLLPLELVNPRLEVINLVVLVHKLHLMLLQLLLMLLQFLLHVLDLLGLGCLEILKLTDLSDGGLLCLTQKAAVLK
jgi:hypothetical protein